MKVDRLMSIILVLLEKKRISAQALADMFEVSLRTIYRDIDAIDLAGIPIRSISGVGGGFEIMPNFKIDQKVFSSADLSAILIGLSSISNMVENKELIHAFTKVKSFIPTDQIKDMELKVNQIHIDLSHWIGNNNIQPYIHCIKTALNDHKLLSFSYIAHHGNASTRTLEPYQLVFKNSHWYLYGYCLERKDFRLFRLSRMSNLIMLEEHFIYKDYPQPELAFTDVFSTMKTDIKIRIHKSIMDRVLDYCAFDQFIIDDDAHYIVYFPFIENDYYYDILLSFGNQCECLEPPQIRKKLIDKINEIVMIYKNDD